MSPGLLARASTLSLSLALLAAVLVFSQAFSSCFTAPKVLAIVVFTGFALALAPGRLRRAAAQPFALPLAAVLLTALLGFARSGNSETYALNLSVILFCALAAVLARAISESRGELRVLLAAFITAHVLCGAYAVIQYLGYDFLVWKVDYGRGRVFSTIGNPNFLAGQVVLALPFLAALGTSGTGLLRWAARVAFALDFLALIFAQTRSAWIGLFAGTLLLLAFVFKRSRSPVETLRRGAWIPLTALVLSAPFLLPGLNRTGLSLVSQIGSSLNVEQQSARQRFFWWHVAARVVRSNPLLGVGMDNFVREFPAFSRQALGSFSDLPPAYCDHPHNDYLFVAGEYGIVGMGVLLWLCAAWIRLCLLGFRRGRTNDLGILAGAVAVAVHAVWNMPSIIQSTVFTAAVLLGMSGAFAAADPADAPRNPRKALRALLLLSAAGGVLLLFTLRPAVVLTAEGYFNGARTFKDRKSYPLSAYLVRQTLRLTNAPWRVNFMLGSVLFAQEFNAEALKAFKKDAEENPWSADAVLHQAKALKGLGLFEAAREKSLAALALTPNYTDAAVNLASIAYNQAGEARASGKRKEEMKRISEARVWINYAVRYNPRDAEAHKLLGRIEIAQGNWREALAAWEKAWAARPGDDYLRGMVTELRARMPELLRKGKKR